MRTTDPLLLFLPPAGAILLDLDGTLADTDPLHAQAWQTITSSHFGITFSWPDYHQAVVIEGRSPADFLLSLGADVRSAEIRQEKASIFRQLMRTRLTLAPGAEPFLALAAREGITLAVVSGGSRSSVDSFLAVLWPGRPPEVSISRDDTAFRKPHPEPYVLALAKLRRPASDCIAIEDTIRGIESASRAGLRSVLVTPDHDVASGSHQSWKEADLTVSTFEQLALSPLSHGGWALKKTATSPP